MVEGIEKMQTIVQCYNDLCKQAIELSEKRSLSEKTYAAIFHVLVHALKNCVHLNNSNNNNVETSKNSYGLHKVEENQVSHAIKPIKKRTPPKKRKTVPTFTIDLLMC